MDTSLAYTLHKLVFAMDREADKVLKEKFDISYQRAYFLFTLQQIGTVSQQKIAAKLGYSAASVSVMVTELAKKGLVTIEPDPTHGRKRLVSLTPEGQMRVEAGNRLLSAKLSETIARAGIDESEYRKLTHTLYNTVIHSQEGEK